MCEWFCHVFEFFAKESFLNKEKNAKLGTLFQQGGTMGTYYVIFDSLGLLRVQVHFLWSLGKSQRPQLKPTQEALWICMD